MCIQNNSSATITKGERSLCTDGIQSLSQCQAAVTMMQVRNLTVLRAAATVLRHGIHTASKPVARGYPFLPRAALGADSLRLSLMSQGQSSYGGFRYLATQSSSSATQPAYSWIDSVSLVDSLALFKELDVRSHVLTNGIPYDVMP